MTGFAGETKITHMGHSSLAIEKDDLLLVIDPGNLSSHKLLRDANAVLVTHKHPDHIVPEALDGSDAQVWGPQEVIELLAEAGIPEAHLHPAEPGDTFTAAGFSITAFGGSHAAVYPGMPVLQNNAYLIDNELFHPGDSFTTAPDPANVRVLFTPIAAPWLKLAETIDFVRAHPSADIVPIHDAILSPEGIGITDGALQRLIENRAYRRLGYDESLWT
ncbi:MBL fold metallo-hydrolase [Gulosibacter chungangensis]|uniref:MBL fold metallo-hydrolase n=1 Tax=Gulosibacter chungangensis TaxID=979746 RepID=A0A7J5BAF0_9MICO|nr:MBL fold metallo-hydrolase [Gulosibacter chungangensis]KAB1642747.1 MBL fold metallo-hydrolase [Gulosibacter chungangensis]